ncbi:hypothetical protein [Flavobacterium cerinum]|uniref:Uncharacterized protein n=1 Tax=Flavobacterium cerinum TaxID=2502784 RepID=A0ABY5IPP4_9FLAO|nr:hypothetical protein [Flavobacterium cerinum]UUC44210.1 hypothetical protein NOX80_11260 [Flavobacterium cerinum]
MTFKVLKNYMRLFENDAKLNVWHQALMNAILQIACLQKQEKVIKVSRRRLMAFSHIATIPTYHKYFKELQDMGYIAYRPSYHPGYKSEVELLIKPRNYWR